MSTSSHVYTDELFENQRFGLSGWSSQLLITDREPFSDRVGDPIKRDTTVDGPFSMFLPDGWKWTSEWYVDKSFTQCDEQGWSYGDTFSSLDKKAYEQQSRPLPLEMDKVRRRRWIRTRERTNDKYLPSNSNVSSSTSSSRFGSQSYSTTSSKRCDEFGHESSCQYCSSKFSLFKRRHHCRSCYAAVCIDCSAKVAPKSSPTRAQIYCTSCIIQDDDLSDMVRSSSRKSSSGISNSNYLQSTPNTPSSSSIKSQTQVPKFCIECGYELRNGVKFCIQCGSSVQLPSSLPPQSSSSPTPKPSNVTIASPPKITTSPIIQSNVNKDKDSKTTFEKVEGQDNKLLDEISQLKEQLNATRKNLAMEQKKVIELQQSNSNSISCIQIQENIRYAPYFKLLREGHSRIEEIKSKMKMDGLDPELLETPSLIVTPSTPAETKKQITIEEDEVYAKYFKLIKMGMPKEQVQLKMSSAGLDPNKLDTPNEISSRIKANEIYQTDEKNSTNNKNKIMVKDDEEYGKYFKLLKMGMPKEQIQLKMSSAGLNPAFLDTPDATISSKSSSSSSSTSSNSNVLKGLPPPVPAVESNTTSSSISVKPNTTIKSPPKEPEIKLPKKAIVKPTTEMRSLFWTRVPVNVVSQTIWMEMTDQNITLDSSEMEWFFRKRTDGVTIKKIGDKKESVRELPKQVLLLDPKRQHNAGIAIARFRMPASEMKAALLVLDEEKLGIDELNALISIEPTVEEQDMIKSFDGDIKLLGNVERFFHELLTIPRITQRVKCFRFKLTFEDRVLETQSQLDTLSAATDQLSDSKKFQKVLEIVLAIGNYLNGDTPRGAAYGFKLDALTKLHTIKSIDSKISLMHYIVRQIEEEYPDLIAFPGELPHITQAKRISITQLRNDINIYNSELEMLQGQVLASENVKNNGLDKFYTIMSQFQKNALEVKEELNRDMNNLESIFSELVTSYGEDSRKISVEEFFGYICEFVEEFKKAYRDNQSTEFKGLWENNKVLKDEAEEEERVKKQQSEVKVNVEYVSGAEAKSLYSQIINQITTRANELGNVNEVEQFKQISRKYGSQEINAEQFVHYIGRTFGSKVVVTIVPDLIKLLPDKDKRDALSKAHQEIINAINKDREDKKMKREKQAVEEAAAAEIELRKEAEEKAKKKANTKAVLNQIAKLKIEDIKPLEGEEAQQLHKSILDSIRHELNNDNAKVKEFSSKARHFGNEQINVKEFYKYLTDSFENDFVARLVPDLARLLHDAEKRHGLLKALCESAPGWARFAGC